MNGNELFLKAGINLLAAFILTYFMFYKRYKRKEIFVSAMILNVCVFGVMSILTDGNIGLEAGLGLFAILSILRFRSENFKKMDMAYFFGAVALAAVNGIGNLDMYLLFANALILSVVLIIDSKLFMLPIEDLVVNLDFIPKYLFDEKVAIVELRKHFDLDITTFEIREIDYIKDSVELELHYTPRTSPVFLARASKHEVKNAL